MEQKRLTQGEMARQLGITRPYLNRILNGKDQPSKVMAKRIAKMTGMSYWDLRSEDRRLAQEYLRSLAQKIPKHPVPNRG